MVCVFWRFWWKPRSKTLWRRTVQVILGLSDWMEMLGSFRVGKDIG